MILYVTDLVEDNKIPRITNPLDENQIVAVAHGYKQIKENGRSSRRSDANAFLKTWHVLAVNMQDFSADDEHRFMEEVLGIDYIDPVSGCDGDDDEWKWPKVEDYVLASTIQSCILGRRQF